MTGTNRIGLAVPALLAAGTLAGWAASRVVGPDPDPGPAAASRREVAEPPAAAAKPSSREMAEAFSAEVRARAGRREAVIEQVRRTRVAYHLLRARGVAEGDDAALGLVARRRELEDQLARLEAQIRALADAEARLRASDRSPAESTGDVPVEAARRLLLREAVGQAPIIPRAAWEGGDRYMSSPPAPGGPTASPVAH